MASVSGFLYVFRWNFSPLALCWGGSSSFIDFHCVFPHSDFIYCWWYDSIWWGGSSAIRQITVSHHRIWSIKFGLYCDNLQKEIGLFLFSHPYVTIFHLLFRGAALLTYIFFGWFNDSFITTFVFVILLLSADFWTVKNITGRLLVGLRWWNYIDDNGESHWVYESKQVPSNIRF